MRFVTAPTAPRSLIVVYVTDTTVTLSWMSPDPPNGIVTQYQVQYRVGSSGGYTQMTVTTDLNYTVTGLNINTAYDFRVRALTVVGRGPPSNVVIVFIGKLCSISQLYNEVIKFFGYIRGNSKTKM